MFYSTLAAALDDIAVDTMPEKFFLITFFSRALGKSVTVFLPEEDAHELPELTRLLKLGDGDYAITLGDRCHDTCTYGCQTLTP